MKRRTLLVAGAAAGGALLVGWGALPPRARIGRPSAFVLPDAGVALNGWIRIGADAMVQLAMPRAEMGQGVHTALVMLAAEELGLAPADVVPVAAGHDALYGNVAMAIGELPFQADAREPGRETATLRAAAWFVAKAARELGIQVTGASASVADAWDVVRLAAATARAQLVHAASLRWRLPADELSVARGRVQHAASGQEARFADLARAAAATPPGEVRVKPRDAWTLIGTPAPRIDTPAKVDGRAVFGIDVRLPGLLYAAIRHAPQLGGSPGAADVDAVLRRPGVERVVRLGPVAGSTAALAVVARSSWQAQRAAAALDVQWQPPPRGALSSAAVEAELLRRVQGGGAAAGDAVVFHRRGDVDAALAAAPRRLAQAYRAPHAAHAALEPPNATARVAGGRVELWLPTQAAGPARALAAALAGVAPDAVTVHVTALGGGFGRRLELDVVGQAVRIAMEAGGRPVQLLWSREEDLTHDFYRPAAAAHLEAGIDADGRIAALAITSAGDAPFGRWAARVLPPPVRLPARFDPSAAQGLIGLPYAIAHRRIAHVAVDAGVPIGLWRSVGHAHHAFCVESFIDEIAHATVQDPVALRLGMLAHLPRHAAVLHLAAAKAGWGTPAPAGRARGVALHESFGSIVAMVVEAGAGAGGLPRAHRVVVAADVGTVVNPNLVAQQMESGVVFGLAAALHGRIDIDDGRVRQRNFHELRLPTIAETPAIETHLVASAHPPRGAGEPGVPPLAPALANAWFALTGERLRELPLRPTAAPPSPAPPRR